MKERLKRHGWVLLFVPLAFLLFANALGTYFHSDDFELLYGVKHGGPFGIWAGKGQPFFRPLVSFTIWSELKLWGLNPVPFRVFNVLLHAGSAVWVVLISRIVLRRVRPDWEVEAFWPAGLLFVALACHSEAIAWISGRTDALATFFGLGALFFALRGNRWVGVGLLLLGLLSKESVATIPLLLALYAVLVAEDKADRRRLLVTSGAMIGLVVLFVGLRWIVLGKLVAGYSVAITPSGVAGNMGLYLGKAILPGSLQSFVLSPSLSGLVAFVFEQPKVVALGLVGLLAVGLFFARRSFKSAEWRLVGFSLLGFFVLALPSLPLGMSKYTAEGERFLYLPSVLLCVVACFLVLRVRSFVARMGLLAVVCLPHAMGLLNQNAAWAIAGEDTRLALDAASPAPITFVSVPDSYRGAYVLRNGLAEAIALRSGSRPSPGILTTYSYETRGSEPVIVTDGDRVFLQPSEATAGSLLYEKPSSRIQLRPTIHLGRFTPLRAELSYYSLSTTVISILTPQGIREVPWPARR